MSQTPGEPPRPPARTPLRQGLRWGAAGLALLVILRLTLGGIAQDAASAEATDFWCVLCGTFGTADFILNVLLFVPLGIALRLVGLPAPVILATGLALSGLIEAVQLGIPGRFSVVGDILANTAGTVLGAALAGGGPLSVRRRSSWKREAAALAVVGVLWLTSAAAFLPSLPRSAYYGQWTPQLGQFDRYLGSVVSARIGTTPAPGHRLPRSDAARAALLAGEPVTVTFSTGPATGRLAPIFSVFDDRQREILVIGADGHDLVLHLRRRAADLLLHGPELRWQDALAGYSPGDTVTVSAWREDGSRTCVALGDARRCDRPGVGRGWVLLLGPEQAILGSLGRLPDLAWLTATSGAGLWAAPGLPAVAGGGAVLGIWLVVAELLVLR